MHCPADLVWNWLVCSAELRTLSARMNPRVRISTGRLEVEASRYLDSVYRGHRAACSVGTCRYSGEASKKKTWASQAFLEMEGSDKRNVVDLFARLFANASLALQVRMSAIALPGSPGDGSGMVQRARAG